MNMEIQLADLRSQKKQKAKNLSSNTPDEQHTTTTSEAKLDEKCLVSR